MEDKDIEKASKDQEKPKKAPYNSIYHKLKRKLILFCLRKIKSVLVKYDKIDQKEDISEYLSDNIKKPVVKWFTSILVTAAVICLALSCMGVELPRAMPTSLGISLIWWLTIELFKDLKKALK